jgi:hypothetical protein
MTTVEPDQITIEVGKAKKGVIGNVIGFSVGLLVTILTLVSPSPIFLLAWGAIIFCPISAIRSYRRYKKLMSTISMRGST